MADAPQPEVPPPPPPPPVRLPAGLMILSIVIVLGFLIIVGWKLYQGNDVQLEIGAMIAAFTLVMGFWFGSSVGSARKTELLAKSKPLEEPPKS